MRTKTRILAILLCGAILSGCSESGKPKTDNVRREAVSSNKISKSVGYATSDVVSAANQLMFEKGLKWGDPVEVRWQKEHDRYLAIYPTPEKERTMGGGRGVFVWTNGNAALMPQL
jgi:hypothetical protein